METTDRKPDDTTTEDDLEPLPDNRLLSRIGAYSRYVALLAAWIASCGSLYMSEALGWVPCLLCWYQRILMYPLALITAVGILTNDRRMHRYLLVLSAPGMLMSLYHYLYQKTDFVRTLLPTSCVIGVPCSADYLNWLGGVVTIPFLALIAFIVITLSAIASRLADEPEGEVAASQVGAIARGERGQRMLRVWLVLIIVAAVVISFLVAGNATVRGQAAARAAVTPVVTSAPAGPAQLAKGKAVYESVCIACHGPSGEGVASVKSIVGSALLQTGTDAELLHLVRTGRQSTDTHASGVPMPAGGGRTDLADEDILAVIAYMRTLARAEP